MDVFDVFKASSFGHTIVTLLSGSWAEYKRRQRRLDTFVRKTWLRHPNNDDGCLAESDWPVLDDIRSARRALREKAFEPRTRPALGTGRKLWHRKNVVLFTEAGKTHRKKPYFMHSSDSQSLVSAEEVRHVSVSFSRVCDFCRTSAGVTVRTSRLRRLPRILGDSTKSLGMMLAKSHANVCVHQRCMDFAFSLEMVQNLELDVDEQLDGYAISAIRAQLKESRRCGFCGAPGATTSCAHNKCKSTKASLKATTNKKAVGWYHLSCGFQNGTWQDKENRSYCPHHAQLLLLPTEYEGKESPTRSTSCVEQTKQGDGDSTRELSKKPIKKRYFDWSNNPGADSTLFIKIDPVETAVKNERDNSLPVIEQVMTHSQALTLLEGIENPSEIDNVDVKYEEVQTNSQSLISNEDAYLNLVEENRNLREQMRSSDIKQRELEARVKELSEQNSELCAANCHLQREHKRLTAKVKRFRELNQSHSESIHDLLSSTVDEETLDKRPRLCFDSQDELQSRNVIL